MREGSLALSTTPSYPYLPHPPPHLHTYHTRPLLFSVVRHPSSQWERMHDDVDLNRRDTTEEERGGLSS